MESALPSNLTKIVRFLASTAGRDKTFRLLFFLTKLLPSLAPLNVQLLATRRLLRFGREFGLFKEIKEIWLKGREKHGGLKIMLLMKIISKISLSVYFLVDHLIFLGKVGLISSLPNLEKSSYLIWLISNFISLFTLSYEILAKNKRVIQLQNHPSSPLEITRLNEQIEYDIIDLLRVFIDIPVALSFMLEEKLLTNVSTSVMGGLSSYIGCYQNWIGEDKRG